MTSVYHSPSVHSPHSRSTNQRNAVASEGLGEVSSERNLYSLIQQDPRYIRWLYRLCPELFSKEKLKSIVDPAYIPFIGMFVNLYRARDINKRQKKQLHKLGKAMDESKREHMKQSAKEEKVVEAAKGTASAALHFLPVGQLLGPFVNVLGGGASNTVLNPVIKLVAGKTAQEGAKRDAAKLSQEEEIIEIDDTTFESWQACRAFFLYLGYPATNDYLYQKWEPARLQLKEAFGARPQDDLYTMKPDNELENKLRGMEKNRREYDMHQLPGVSYLLLLWRAFDCWNIPYYDKLHKLALKGRTMDMNDDHIRMRIREKEREKDLVFIKKMMHPDDSHIMLLESKLMEKDAEKLLVASYSNTPRMRFLEHTEKEYRKEEKDEKKQLEKEQQAVVAPKEAHATIPFELTINFVEAVHLEGASDPYITAKIITSQTKKKKHPKVKTKVMHDSRDPTWNTEEKLLFYEADDVLEVTVRDYERFSKDKIIGKFTITLSELAYGVSVDKWFDLIPVDHGRVHLILTKRQLPHAVRAEQLEKSYEQKRWIANYLLEHFSSKGECWVYFDESVDDAGLLAVALFEPPNTHLDVHKSLAKSSISGAKSLNPRGYKDFCDLMNKEESAKNKVCKDLNFEEKKVGVIHWLAYKDHTAARNLVKAISNNPYPTLFLSYKDDMPVTHGAFLAEFGFSETHVTPYGFQFLLHNPPEWYVEGEKRDYERS